MTQQTFSSTGSFFVQDRSGRYYPATFLTYSDGTPIVDAVLANGLTPHSAQHLTLYADQQGTSYSNPDNYLVVPSADYMNNLAARGQVYGDMLQTAAASASTNPEISLENYTTAGALLAETFAPKFGPGDAQYQNTWGAGYDTLFRSPEYFIPAFTNAGNFGAGVFYANAGSPSDEALQTFGYANTIEGGRNSSAQYGNSPWGFAAINQGYQSATPATFEDRFSPQNNLSAPTFNDRWNALESSASPNGLTPEQANGLAGYNSQFGSLNAQSPIPYLESQQYFGATASPQTSGYTPSPEQTSYTPSPEETYTPPTYTPTLPSTYGGYYGWDGGGGDDDWGPVVLDLAGNGINITQLSSSNTFEDVTGSGTKSLTAWAGVGNGVLFVDTTGLGQLTQANQVVFTDWDPGATSDMQALLDVFDTNHDGMLDADDADFSKFFVMVTNADGTQT
ncbi:MAG TPA: hypothetical protein VH079_17090, partial [Terriglobales bacterium]|nr:hypothetical protein [Terriglobales bacterium]